MHNEDEPEAEPETFAEIIKRNAENEERIKKERDEANEKVKRSYRLKEKK